MLAHHPSANDNLRFQGQRALLTYTEVGNFDAAYDFAGRVVDHIALAAGGSYRWKWAVEPDCGEETEPGDLEAAWVVRVAVDFGKQCTANRGAFDFEGHHPKLEKGGGRVQWEEKLTDLQTHNCYASSVGPEGEEAQAEEDVLVGGVASGEGHGTRSTGRTFPRSKFINVPRAMSEYATYINSDEERERPRGLIIISPTRYGKTVWARSIHTDHAYLQGEWNVDCIRADAKLLIFDNVSMSELLPSDRYKAFMGMETHFSITGKYRRRKPVTRGWKGFIYLCNVDPRTERGVSPHAAAYITENCDIITLDRKLYAA
jgi:hypothetical protein